MRKTVPDGATGPVDCQIEAGGWADIDLPGLANRAARAALEHLGLTDPALEISLLATDDGRISALNADFRGKPTPTNVLSWPSEERGAEVHLLEPAELVVGQQDRRVCPGLDLGEEPFVDLRHRLAHDA